MPSPTAAKKGTARKIDWQRYGARSTSDTEAHTWRPKSEGDSVAGTLLKVDEANTKFGTRTVIELRGVDTMTSEGTTVEIDGQNVTIWPSQGLLDELGEAEVSVGDVVVIELTELIDTGKGNAFKRFEIEVRA